MLHVSAYFLGHQQASAYNYTTVHIFSTIFYVYMLIVYIHYTLYCLYSTNELYYHRARWLGVPCTWAYMVLAAYWVLYIAGILSCTCLASSVGVALLTCWVLLDLCVCIQILVSWDSCLLLMRVCLGVFLLTY
jgi:hypothetical protein